MNRGDALDLAIIGAPKAGSSSLFYWLAEHPAIQASTPKETFYFMDRDHPLAGRHGPLYSDPASGGYDTFLPRDVRGCQRMEATTHYFYQSTAREQLARMQPQPHVVMLLREPAVRALSSFRFTRDNLANCDRSLTFDQYVDWLLTGKSNKLDRYYRSKTSLWISKCELEFGKYVVWLDWWLKRFSPERFQLILFENLRDNPGAVIMNLCERLDIEPSFYHDFSFHGKNLTYAVGKQGIHRFLRQWAPLVPRHGIRDRLKTVYLRWQDRVAAPDAGYEEGLERMRAYFAPWNRELENRYKLDIAFWWGEAALKADQITTA